MRIAAGREILCHDDLPTERRFRRARGYRARARTNMLKLDLTYVVLGALWLVLGMILGIVMGASENFAYAPLHAHINLVGFTCHSIFGIVYRLWPSMKTSALAPFQFWIFVIATPMVPTIWLHRCLPRRGAVRGHRLAGPGGRLSHAEGFDTRDLREA